MMKGMIPKFSMGVALAAALALGWASTAKADLDGLVSYTEPRGVLVMPFDATEGHESFQIVSRIGNQIDEPVATHWAYWSEDCQHLANVIKCLTQDDTTVADPKNLQGERQTISPPANVGVGGSFDLSGHRGIVVVTAHLADVGLSGQDCRILSPDPTDDEIVGGWTIADTTTNAAFGSDAIGLFHDELPDASTYLGEDTTGLYVQTFNPPTLGDSDVILFTVETAAGNSSFTSFELGPIRGRGSPSVSCHLEFVDDIEVPISLPDVEFDCALFAPISAAQGSGSLIPASATVDSPLGGFLNVTNCEVFDPDGFVVPIGDGSADGVQFLFAYHGQAVGQYGAVVSGKYTEFGQL